MKTTHFTQRLQLREWLPQDLAPFAQLNQDPNVMEYFPNPLTTEQSQKFIEKISQHFKTHGYGLWAVTLKDTQEFIGYVGLNHPDFEAHFTPCIEIGWRLASKHWGKGYATEAATFVLQWAFENTPYQDILSFTVPANLRSIRVMEKLGMTRNVEDNFLHPKLPSNHPLALHVLYRAKIKK